MALRMGSMCYLVFGAQKSSHATAQRRDENLYGIFDFVAFVAALRDQFGYCIQ
jgi:hypothetical protein